MAPYFCWTISLPRTSPHSDRIAGLSAWTSATGSLGAITAGTTAAGVLGSAGTGGGVTTGIDFACSFGSVTAPAAAGAISVPFDGLVAHAAIVFASPSV